MKRKYLQTFLFCLVSAFVGNTASASMFKFNATNLSETGGEAYNSLSMTVDGIDVDITAYTIENDGQGNLIGAGKTQIAGDGLGVYISSSTSGNIGVTSSGDGTNNLDAGRNSMTDLDEGLMFSFSTEVSLDYINFDNFFSEAGRNKDDFNLTVDGVRILWDHNANDGDLINVSTVPGQVDEFNFNLIQGTNFLLWGDDSTDSFRIDRFEVTEVSPDVFVPVPPTFLLLASGFAGLAAFRRKVVEV